MDRGVCDAQARTWRRAGRWVAALVVLCCLAGCRMDGLSGQERETLSSLTLVDPYPLYAMHYRGSYQEQAASGRATWREREGSGWSCSLFTALGDAAGALYGRNFDWEYSPALLLFTDPPDGYASVSMVDIAYLGFEGDRAREVADLSLAERQGLLRAPLMPFDGMNERGLAVGMAAVPPGDMRSDPDKETVGSLRVIREMLDRAADVDEAVAILDSYNVDMGGGPPVHYMVADVSGQAVLVEFYEGERVLIPAEDPWHVATNFLRASAGDSAAGRCARYDRIAERLSEVGGRLTVPQAVDLLSDVAQPSTQWSVVYGIHSGEVHVTMGRAYEDLHTFSISSAE